ILVLAGYGTVQAIGYFNFKNLQNQCYQKISSEPNVVTFYFASKSDPSKIQLIVSDMASFPDIVSASFISTDEELAAFKKAHSGDPTISSAVNALATNPFEPGIEV